MYTNWCYLYHIFIQTLDFFNLNTWRARTHLVFEMLLRLLIIKKFI